MELRWDPEVHPKSRLELLFSNVEWWFMETKSIKSLHFSEVLRDLITVPRPDGSRLKAAWTWLGKEIFLRKTNRPWFKNRFLFSEKRSLRNYTTLLIKCWQKSILLTKFSDTKIGSCIAPTSRKIENKEFHVDVLKKWKIWLLASSPSLPLHTRCNPSPFPLPRSVQLQWSSIGTFKSP